ncbi:hypothetical protein GALMADRAFT_272272 [Galerina marginata CBS 339.88]|uniref:Uncharacterized protein n=1 Tax=Galerina marginata (strain CBS 339.88) TaxID=685588 RepID=A0A067SQ53_GALM3|nr:hypothetical protein GALMADRAFT_272272 [Galerina marginata CBS 339.88]
MTFPYILSVLLFGLQLSSALPASRVAGSADINHVIQHTHEDSYYRRDDISIYARTAPSCTPLTLDQVKALPGWSKIQQYATDTYGDGGVNIVVNPPEYPNAPATVCLQDGPVQITLKGAPSCSTSDTAQFGGKITGTTGSYQLAFQQGYSNDGSWTITQESSLASGATVGITIGIPDVAGASADVTTTTTVTNSLSKSFSTTISNQQTQTVSVNTVDGKPCMGTMTTTTCNAPGTGSASYVASGSVWFNYDDARAPKSDPNGAKHYKYAVDIATAVPNINDRSSSMLFTGSMQISSKTNFNAKC